MICRLEILLKENAELTFQMGPLFHGALMELLPETIAEELHSAHVHPYAQYLERRNNRWYWVITALTEHLSKEMLYACVLPQDGIVLKKPEIEVEFEGKRLHEVSMKALAERLYNGLGNRYIRLQFLTPTSFKQQGQYLFYPDIRGMYISLLNKYAAAEPSQNVRDEDLLQELVSGTRITRYNLKSVSYQVENVRIPAFIGSVTLRVNGTQTMRNFADFLFHFGEYSGIGIKGGLGMGGLRVSDDNPGKPAAAE